MDCVFSSLSSFTSPVPEYSQPAPDSTAPVLIRRENPATKRFLLIFSAYDRHPLGTKKKIKTKNKKHLKLLATYTVEMFS